MKFFNNHILIPVAVIAFTVTACSKKLDVSPKQSIDAATALTNSQDVDAAVIGCYSIMGSGSLYGTNLILMPDLLAADATSGATTAARYATWSGTFTGPRQVYSKTMVRENGEASRTWIAAYQAINTANTVLEALNVVTDPAQKTKNEGEALFVRGVMHFELVRLYALPWGFSDANDQLGVIIRTKAAKDELTASEKTPRNTVAQVYAQVITDLTAAAAKLPATNGTRLTKYAALAFLSRVYLQQKNYSKALEVANQVIASTNYRLNASVGAVFSNKNTAESIWEIQQNDQNNAGTSNDGLATFYASYPGIGRADVRVATGFVNTYYPTTARVDSIRDASNALIRVDTFPDARRNELFYIGTGARPGNTYTSKWRSFSQNIPVIRIAEMYLTRSECNLRLGTSVGATASNDYNTVRSRANYRPVSTVTLNNVLDERLRETAFEGVRIHDIKRLQLSVGANAWNANKLVFPIPQREVDATQGVIVQNPGY